MSMTEKTARVAPIPLWLRAFTYALMGAACAINGAFVALAIPAMAPFGITGLFAAAAVGAVVGIWPAQWLARRIADGISDEH